MLSTESPRDKSGEAVLPLFYSLELRRRGRGEELREFWDAIRGHYILRRFSQLNFKSYYQPGTRASA